MTEKRPRLHLVAEDEDLSNILITDEDEAEAEIRKAARRPQQPRAKGRKFIRFDAVWAEKLLPLLNPLGRLALVLLAKADFHRRIPIGRKVETEAALMRQHKRELLEQLERLGLIEVEWRGRGRVPIVTPLDLHRRPDRP